MEEGSEIGEGETVVSFTEANNTYRTSTISARTTVGGRTAEQATVDINPQTTIRHFQVGRTAFSIGDVIKRSSRADCLSSCLLSVALLASIFNTFLISFVIKSIQLNNRGLMNGKVNWDDQAQSTVFEPFTKLPGKSISVKSIESTTESGLLKLALWPAERLEGKGEEDGDGNEMRLFLSSLMDQDGELVPRQQSNYMAAHYPPLPPIDNNVKQAYRSKARLMIRAKSLVLKLLLKSNNLTEASGNNKLKSAENLLEFNGEQESITLPVESKLSLSPQLAGSITVKDRLSSPQITGSLDDDLNVQSPKGNLACQSGKTMHLVSKAGSLQLATVDEVRLRASELQFNSSHIHLEGNGLQYIDLDEPSEQSDQQPLTQSRARRIAGSLEPLMGYDLVTVNGLLFAS